MVKEMQKSSQMRYTHVCDYNKTMRYRFEKKVRDKARKYDRKTKELDKIY